MNEQLKSVTDWLNAHKQQTVMIRKQEMEDTDQTRIQLEEVEYRENTPTIDDYTEGDSLILHGNGTVINEQGEIQLPQNTYQIYVDGLSKADVKETQLTMETDRAKYEIFIQS